MKPTTELKQAVRKCKEGKIFEKITKASIKTKMIASTVAVVIIGGIILLWNGKQEMDDTVSEHVLQSQENETAKHTDVMDLDSTNDITGSQDFESRELQEESGWQSVYIKFLSGLDHDAYEGFDLHDLNEDGIPEILLKNREENHIIEIYYFQHLTNEVKAFPSYEYNIGPSMGYGSTATEFIYLSYKDKNFEPYHPEDLMAFRVVDFEIVEMIRMTGGLEYSEAICNIETKDSSRDVPYEQGQQRVEELEEIYQPIDYKPLDEKTIENTINTYL